MSSGHHISPDVSVPMNVINALSIRVKNVIARTMGCLWLMKTKQI